MLHSGPSRLSHRSWYKGRKAVEGSGAHLWPALWRVAPWVACVERSERDLGLVGETARVSLGTTWNLSSRFSRRSLGACANAQASPAGQAPVSCGARADRAQSAA